LHPEKKSVEKYNPKGRTDGGVGTWESSINPPKRREGESEGRGE
jgi:hypothetical protein